MWKRGQDAEKVVMPEHTRTPAHDPITYPPIEAQALPLGPLCPDQMNDLRVATNSLGFARYWEMVPGRRPVSVISANSPLTSVVKVLREAHVVLIECDPRLAYLLGGLSRLPGMRAARLIFADPVLLPPRSLLARVVDIGRRALLGRIDLFLVHQIDIDGYARSFGITPERTRFIPFKVNFHGSLPLEDVPEEPYVFCGGITQRDWDTTLRALILTGHHGVISIPTLDERDLFPEDRVALAEARALGVEVRLHPMEDRSWVERARRATVIVLPVKANAMNPAGISTLLTCMALGRPIVTGDGPATYKVFPPGVVTTYRRGDASSLAKAITLAWNDGALRREQGAAARKYAEAVGGEDSLYRNYEQAIAMVTK